MGAQTGSLKVTRVLVLIATIPPRRASCERLLRELTKQSRQPDALILCCDGYGGKCIPAPTSTIPLAYAVFTPFMCGPGRRWQAALDAGVDPEDIIINLDDDVYLGKAPELIRALVTAVEEGGAAAAMGMTPDGKRAPPGRFSRGNLIYAAGCGLALRTKHLEGLQELAAEVKAAGGPDALGVCGDDDALVSAHLWRKGITIKHAATGVIQAALGSQDVSQTKMRLARGEKLDDQKRAIARITGWKWPGS